MTQLRNRGEDARRFLLDNIEEHPQDIVRMAAKHLAISRQAINKHLNKLFEQGCISRSGATRSRSYQLSTDVEWHKEYAISPDLAEDIVWEQDISQLLGKHTENVTGIWQFGFTEMFNNAIDHSGGTKIVVDVRKTAASTEIFLSDNGIGIFKKIQNALKLADERHSVIELAKGKLTTDPKRHTGEGIFFTSRVMDRFAIFSGGVYFSHDFGKARDWVLEKESTSGTSVHMKLNNHTARSTKKIFEQYTSGDDYGFTKTVVPVTLAQYGSDKLISRSQAKRLLARVELFETVLLDFKGVETIGQSFADEIFRVFAQQHRDMTLIAINAVEEVSRMISRARHTAQQMHSKDK